MERESKAAVQALRDTIAMLEGENQQLKFALKELELLNEIAVEASRTADTAAMLELILKKSISAVEAEQGSIQLLDKTGKSPFKTLIRRADKSTVTPRFQVHAAITGWVLKHKEPLVIENLATDARFRLLIETPEEVCTLLGIPIWHDAKMIGLMLMVNKKDQQQFSEDDKMLLSIIAAQAGQLIRNAQLLEDTQQQREALAIEKIEKNQLRELDRMKSLFFSNITHEFRTPLTLILEPLKMLRSGRAGDHPESYYQLIAENTARILRLVDQILALNKLEAGASKLAAAEGDIVHFLRDALLSFTALAERKQIALHFQTSRDEISCYFNVDKMEKIINNLLSNAIKFTGAGGMVKVDIQQRKSSKNIEIRISDTGIGIPAESLTHIFDRFYQVEHPEFVEQAGFGIGLALTRQLVEAHHGTISAESEIGKGSVFLIKIPASKSAFSEEELCPEDFARDNQQRSTDPIDFIDPFSIEEDVPEEASNSADDRKVVLIVDDHGHLRKFIQENIDHTLKVLSAADGEAAWKTAEAEIPDIVVSDIKMPRMNGIELCRKIKQDERTSHIPVILLTARAETTDRLEGLETGADAYMTKPFDMDELNARIKNLITQRELLRQRFGREITLEPGHISITSLDERFLQRAIKLVENNIENSDFNAEVFAKNIGISHSQLYRKLKALTDLSITGFIRLIRLKRAAQLLAKQGGNIAQIAYAVGFSNPAYFAECFRKQFGQLPSRYSQSASKSE